MMASSSTVIFLAFSSKYAKIEEKSENMPYLWVRIFSVS
jgi:hypothetical protein